MTSKVTVRDYRDRDQDAVISIICDLQNHERQFSTYLKPTEEIGPWYIEELQRDIKQHRGRFLVAEVFGTIAGYATLLTNCDSSDAPDEILYQYAHIGDLAVAKEQRRCGIGAALIAECELSAKSAGINLLRLAVLPGNTMARDFYRKSGFSDVLIRLEKPL